MFLAEIYILAMCIIQNTVQDMYGVHTTTKGQSVMLPVEALTEAEATNMIDMLVEEPLAQQGSWAPDEGRSRVVVVVAAVAHVNAIRC